MKNTKKAFTLVELLIVIAIIGILVGMLTPMISSAQKRAVASTSKTFLINIASALERYQAEYGYFPDFLASRDRVNLADENFSEGMIKALTGKTADGARLSQSDRKEYNRKARNFIDIAVSNIVKKNGKNMLVDSFENPNIYVCVDADNDGFIKSGLPNISDGFSIQEVREIVPNQSSGIRSKAVLFTLKKDSFRATADYTSENVFTWY